MNASFRDLPPFRWKEVRVFISSTFRDFHAERDYLVKFVFPELHQWCIRYRLHLTDIDLRWGVTAGEAESGKVIDICLEQVDGCRPFFISLLGSRYGWVPNTSDIPRDTLHRYSKLLDPKKGNYSITHMEIHHAVLEPLTSVDVLEEAPHAFFYFRNLGSIPQPEEISDWNAAEREEFAEAFYDRDPAAAARLADLKQAVRGHYETIGRERNRPQEAAERIFDYHPVFDPLLKNPEDERLRGRLKQNSLKAFGSRVLADLTRAIGSQYSERIAFLKEKRDSDSLEAELDLHETFAELRSRGFTGRSSLLKRLMDYSQSELPQICVIHGESGTGKSALLAQLYKTLKDHASGDVGDSGMLIIPHFAGASPGSTSTVNLLERLCRRIFNACLKEGMERRLDELKSKGEGTDKKSAAIRREYEIPADAEKLPAVFRTFLEMTDRRVIILIDGLNQMDESSMARAMPWLPDRLRPNIKILISTLPGVTFDFLRKKTDECVAMTPLTREERKEIIRRIPKLFAKTLSEDLLEVLLNREETTNPLYLKVALEELRLFGGFGKKGERLAEYVQRFPSDVVGLFGFVLARLERDHSDAPGMVKRLFCLLESSRFGLTQNEIAELLVDDRDQTHRIILRQMRDYLFWHGEVVDFFHKGLSEAVQRTYGLTDRNTAREWSRILAEYFLGTPLYSEEGKEGAPNGRKCLEQPFQLTQAGMRDEAARTLCDLRFIEAKCQASMIGDLIRDYAEFEKADQREDRNSSEFGAFVRSQGHILGSYPHLTLQQAANHPGSSPVLPAALDLWNSGKERRPWVQWLNRVSHRNPCLMTINEFAFQSAFSPDGRLIFTGLSVWDAAAGDRLARLGDEVPMCNAFSPDGKHIASGFGTGEVKVRDAKSFTEKQTIHSGGAQTICAFSPDSTLIASGGSLSAGTVRVFRLSDSVKVGEFPCDKALSFSPDGGTLVTDSGGDKTPSLWDVRTCRRLAELPALHKKGATCCTFSPCGGRLVTGSGDSTLIIWDIRERKELMRLAGHRCGVLCCAYSPDGNTIVSGGEDHTFKLWNTSTGKLMASVLADSESVCSCSFSPKGDRILTAGMDGVKVWDVGMIKSSAAENPLMHEDRVTALAFSAKKQRVATASKDGSLKRWSAETGANLTTVQLSAAGVNDCSFSPDGTRIVAGSDDKTLAVLANDESAEPPEIVDCGEPVERCSYSPDGNRIIILHPCAVKVMEAGNKRIVHTFPLKFGGIESFCTSPDGRLLVAGAEECCPMVDLETNRMVNDFYNSSEIARIPYGVSFSPDGMLLGIGSGYFYTYSHLGVVAVFHLDSLSPEKGYSDWACLFREFDSEIAAFRFSPDGKRILIKMSHGEDGNIVQVWDLRQKKMLYTLESDSEKHALFTSDGARVIFRKFGWIVLADALTGEEITRFPTEGLSSVLKEGHGGLLAVGSASGLVYLLRQMGLAIAEPVMTGVFRYDFNKHDWEKEATVTCGHCDSSFPLRHAVFDAILAIHRNCDVAPDVSPCLVLPDEAWEDRKLFTSCPECGGKLRLNPFVVDYKRMWD